MANKQLFKSRPGRLAPETDARNEAGGKAYALSPKAALAQYVATGVSPSWGRGSLPGRNYQSVG